MTTRLMNDGRRRSRDHVPRHLNPAAKDSDRRPECGEVIVKDAA
jgi:hypothetical protein